MTVLPTSRYLTIGLLLACGGLSFLLFEQTTGDHRKTLNFRESPQVQKERSTVTPGNIREFLLPPIEQFEEITQRSLFTASRRPITTAEGDRINVPQKLSIMLSGVVIDKDRRFAHVRSREDDRIRRLQQGDAIDNWRIDRIEIDRVVLRAGSRQEVLFLKKPGGTNSRAGTLSLKQSEAGSQSRRNTFPTNSSREKYKARRRARDR